MDLPLHEFRASLTAARHRSAGAVDHPGPDGDPGRLIDEDEGPRRPVLHVGVAEHRDGRALLDPSDLVESERFGLLVRVEAVHVRTILDVLDERAV